MPKYQILYTAAVFYVEIIIFFVMSTILTILFDSLHLTDSLSERNKIFFFLSVFFNLIICSTLMMILSCAHSQLHALNTYLSLNLQKYREVSVVQVIKTTSILYDNLCDVIETISFFYCLIILIFLWGFLYFYVFVFFSFYLYVQVPSDDLFTYSLGSTGWLLYYTPCVLWIVVFSSWIEQDACITADLIQQLVNQKHQSRELKSFKSLNILMQQISHRRPKISCGLFAINWNFFFTVIGGIFSFSIILIQFSDDSK